MDSSISTSLHKVRHILTKAILLLLATRSSFINADITVTVDIDPPIVTCLNVTTAPAAPNRWFSTTADYTYTDANPDPSGITYNVSSGLGGFKFPPGHTPVTLFADDVFDNRATCLFFVENPLTELPVNCPSLNRTVDTDPDQTTYTFISDFGVDDVTTSVSQYDYFGDVSVSVTIDGAPNGSSVSVGIHEVVATISDDELSKTCVGYYIVEDNQSPTVNCPENFKSTTLTVNYTPVSTFDLVDPSPTLTYDPDLPPGSVFPLGPTTVTVTSTDSAGNQNQCSFTVTTSVTPCNYCV